jgi:hypothetical protein
VEGTETYRRWLQRATLYAVSMTAAGVVTCAVFAAAGAGVWSLWEGARGPLAGALGAVTLAYALHELGVLRLRVPGRDWQVPASWVHGRFYQSAIIFGSTVGFGVFTRVPFASLPILFGWLFVSGNVVYGVAAGLLYGVTRALPIYSSASCRVPEDVAELNTRLMGLAPLAHTLTGIALAAFASYLLVAPLL